nr:ATP-binding cassette domain-containing protein [Thiocystis violascens]
MSLDAHGLRLTRGGRALIDGVSLTLHPGEVLVVLGANGAGKSTLLRCLSGELKPDAGEIRLNGIPLGHWSAADCARRRAILPQQNPLSFPFTALAHHLSVTHGHEKRATGGRFEGTASDGAGRA